MPEEETNEVKSGVEAAREMRRGFEKAIVNMITTFENATGLVVDSIDVIRDQGMIPGVGYTSELRGVEIEVYL